ncbi:hypothetical protein [Telmatospirillum sp. J64-1]|uniref:hypothetical protein n=1 Tax=Telmatospirillum sp. J64-1 TaxID=2502183 RepID=UPI00115D28CE|nr:hypothetical protein [Telmatospirillum sp. J64-1]
MARRDIQQGQHYRKMDADSVWEVIGLTDDREGIRHARLARVGDPSNIKMISVSALRDSKLYKLLPTPAPSSEA